MSRSSDIRAIDCFSRRGQLLQEFEKDRQSLAAEMHSLVADINIQLDRVGVHRTRQVRKKGGRQTVAARVQSVSGALSVRFSLLNLETRKFTTRARIVEVDRAGASWIVTLPEEHKEQILALDRTRRLLNHRYRILYAEQKSLLLFDREERDLRDALESNSKQLTKE